MNRCVYCDDKGRICPNAPSGWKFLCAEHGDKLTIEEGALLQQANVLRSEIETGDGFDALKASYLLGRTLDRLNLSISQRANIQAMKDRSDTLKRRG